MKCGIVDVGSNTIRLSTYHWEGQTFKLLMNKKEMAGLAGYIKNGLLSDSGILVACRVLAGFKALLRNFDIADLYVFGTASLRNIVNTEEALETIEAVTGIKVEVLSGADEAAFSFLGATVGGGAPGSGMLADVGGGSTALLEPSAGGSSSASVSSGDGTFTITGSGWGHSVGLSQWGAYAMAQQGYTYEDILTFYYTGIEVRTP